MSVPILQFPVKKDNSQKFSQTKDNQLSSRAPISFDAAFKSTSSIQSNNPIRETLKSSSKLQRSVNFSLDPNMPLPGIGSPRYLSRTTPHSIWQLSQRAPYKANSIRSNETESFAKSSQVLIELQSQRNKLENAFSIFPEASCFKHPINKSSEVMNFLIKELSLDSKSKVLLFEKLVALEKSVFVSIQSILSKIEEYKGTYTNLQETEEKYLNLLNDYTQLNKDYESVRCKYEAIRTSHNDDFLKHQRSWQKKQLNLETQIEEFRKKNNDPNSSNRAEDSTRSAEYSQLLLDFRKKEAELRSIIIRLQHDLGKCKDETSDKTEEIQVLNNTIQDLKIAQEAKSIHSQTYLLLRERLYMQYEEILVLLKYKGKCYEHKQTIAKLQETIHFLEAEQDDLKVAENAVNFNDPIFCIFSEAERKRFKHKPNNSRFLRANTARYIHIPAKKIMKSSTITGIRDYKKPDFSMYRLAKPTFAGFVELPTHFKFIYDPPYSLWLEVTIRGILDSKFNEHQLYSFDSVTLPSSFPEFVYSWLGSFFIDEKTRVLKETEWWKKENSNECRLLLLSAMSEDRIKTRKNWEVHTFKEFLQEDAGLDELAFYLHCRNLIFEGPQLSHSKGKFSSLHYVPLKSVFFAIEKTMSTLDSETMNELIGMLRLRSKPISNKPAIDSSLALRVMLEYYRYEKITKINLINTIFSQLEQQKNITFEAFKYILESISSNLPDHTAAKLFRDTWMVGNMQITFDAFITVANEYGLFYHLLGLKGRKDKPNMTPSGVVIPHFSAYAKAMHQVMGEWNSGRPDIKHIRSICIEAGIPAALHSYRKLENLLENRVEIQLEEYGLCDISNVLDHFKALLVRLGGVLIETDTAKAVNLKQGALPSILDELVSWVKQQKLEGITRIVASRIIQRWFRRHNQNQQIDAKRRIASQRSK